MHLWSSGLFIESRKTYFKSKSANGINNLGLYYSNIEVSCHVGCDCLGGIKHGS